MKTERSDKKAMSTNQHPRPRFPGCRARASIYRKAAKQILGQSSLSKGITSEGDCFCTGGAIGYSSTGMRNLAFTEGTNILGTDVSGPIRVAGWNDGPATTKEDAVRFLRHCAYAAEHGGKTRDGKSLQDLFDRMVN